MTSSKKRKFQRAILQHLKNGTINEILKEIQESGLEEYSDEIATKISKITRRIREHERQTESALEYADTLKQEIKKNSVGIMSVEKLKKYDGYDKPIHFQNFLEAGRIIDMYQARDWANLDPERKNALTSFMHHAQKAEKFRMDMKNWSHASKKENVRFMQKHMQEGLGLLPFEKILFQTRYSGENINFHLFEYVSKDIDKNHVVYSHRLLIFKEGIFVVDPKYIHRKTLKVPLDFSKGTVETTEQTLSPLHAFIQLNSHTDKNTNIFDILPKKEKPSNSFTIKNENVDQEEFVPVWKSKTVYIKPDQYRAEKDTTYTSNVSEDGPHEKRYVPFHSVRGHIRRLRKGDITAVKAHFRGQKEYGAIHKNYVLAAPRIIRKGKLV